MVMRLLHPLDLLAVEAGPGRDVGFHADDGLDARFEGGVVELDRAEHVAVVGEGAGLHAQAADALHQVVDLASAVKEGVVAVDVEMHEVRLHRGDYKGGTELRQRARARRRQGFSAGATPTRMRYTCALNSNSFTLGV